MAKEYKGDIFDALGEEATSRMNALGFEFLALHGYDTSEAESSHDKARELKRLMRSRREELMYRVLADSERGVLLFYYELYSCGKLKAKSRAIKFTAGKEQG